MKDEFQTLFATQIIIPAIFQGMQLKCPYIKSLAGLWILEDGNEWPLMEDDDNEDEDEQRGDESMNSISELHNSEFSALSKPLPSPLDRKSVV